MKINKEILLVKLATAIDALNEHLKEKDFRLSRYYDSDVRFSVRLADPALSRHGICVAISQEDIA